MDFSRRRILSLATLGWTMACSAGPTQTLAHVDPGLSFESFDPSFEDIIDTSQAGELLSRGHWWAEGPAWDRERQTLYFTDVPRNIAYAWSRITGEREFLSPSGVLPEFAAGMREPGANGLLLAHDGDLLLCNHGSRSLEALDLGSMARTTLVSDFEGQRFNSPNDLVQALDGTVYFTDPPYGLEGLNESPLKDMEINGVYRLDPLGQITRIVDDMTFPNGVQLSPDQDTLYVSQSDPAAPILRAFDVRGKADGGPVVGGLVEGEIWFDAAPYMKDVEGLPDGMAIAASGHVFLAGPGGVLVVDPQGGCLGRIATGRATANCAFGEDGRTLFMTAKDRLLAVRTKTIGLGTF